jgi:LPPG:FO 2-phospho-L-lactate transferase
MTIVALAGGVGGAKMSQGLQAALGPGELTVIVNTADDFVLYGLRISPDLDTVMYTLAGIADPVQGWGIANDTRQTLAAIAAYGRDPWFQLGDRDFATHILRTELLRGGASLAEVTQYLSESLGVPSRIVPMSNDPVATRIVTEEGTLEFQDYFVARRQSDDVLGVEFAGIDAARPTGEALEAIARADAIVIAPSNPVVSIGPILALTGIRQAIAEASAPVVAVSPIIGGSALKGPAASMLRTLGHEVSALGVARMFGDLIDGFVIDSVDSPLVAQIEALGTEVLVTNSVMGDVEDRRRFAEEVLGFATSISGTWKTLA